MCEVLQKYPGMQWTIFDLEHMLGATKEKIGVRGLKTGAERWMEISSNPCPRMEMMGAGILRFTQNDKSVKSKSNPHASPTARPCLTASPKVP